MKTKKSIALLLCLLLTLTLFVPSSTAFAVEGDSGTDNGMKVSKTATANGDGTYTITLEAYATGSKVISEVKKDIPTDIVLVLDQSGSMDENMNTYSFRQYTNKSNSDFYNLRHNGSSNPNLYYRLEDGSYATVSVTIQYKFTKIEGQTNSFYYENRNELYAEVNGEYQKVTVRKGDYLGWYGYYLPNYSEIASSYGNDKVPQFSGINGLYLLNESENVYTYTCTDKGAPRTIGTSTGASTEPTDFVLYERYVSSTGSRMDALKTAAKGFIDSVATKAKGEDGQIGGGDDVAHRLAVVSYASSTTNHTNGLLDMTVSGNDTTAKNAVNGLNADGGTMIDGGIQEANDIFKNNPIPANDTSGRQRVVIVFTDGAPGMNGNWNSDCQTTANNAVSYANASKNTYGATVYTIGVFEGADASNPKSLPVYTTSSLDNAKRIDNSNRFMHLVSSNYPDATSMEDTGSVNPKLNGDSYYLSASDASTLNNIFQQIANKIESGGSSATLTEEAVVKDIIAPQFTLPENATADSITLETYSYEGVNQWKENSDAMGATATVNGDMVSVTGFNFSDNWCGTVTENGTPTYRGNKLVISFKVVPKDGFLGGNNVYTNTSAGVYADSNATEPVKEFNRPQVNVPIGDITVTAADKNVYLLGSLTAEQLKSGATVSVGGVSLNLAAENYGLESWQTDYVNISVNVTEAPEKPVTTLSNLTDDQIYNVSAVVSPIGTGEGAGGAPVVAKSGAKSANINVFKPVLTFQDSAEDYLSPHEFPGYYGENNYVSTLTAWKHTKVLEDLTTEVKDASTVDMVGTAPSLALVYTADAADITGLRNGTGTGTIAADHDIPVNVAVSIGQTDVTNHVTFNHHQCNRTDLESTCGWSYGDSHAGNATISETDSTSVPEFLIHVKNIVADLTIRKTGLNKYAYTDPAKQDRESAIFMVEATDKTGTRQTYWISLANGESVTIKDLRVNRQYTITEQNSWTWRYEDKDPITGMIERKADGSGVTVTVENSGNNEYWLGGDNYCVNVFASDASTTN